MTRPTTLVRALALASVATLSLAACGGEDGGDTASGATETPSAEGSESPSAEPSASEEPLPTNEGDGTFTVGTLLPETGNLAFLGPPEFAGVDLAVQEINEAGGVLGGEIQKFDSDSGDTSTDTASQSSRGLIEQGADVIIGAASSGVSFTVIDAITGAGVAQISPANTSPDFTDYDDNGLYFRTAPSDVLQGRVVGNVIVGDGNTNIAALALQDPYGDGLLTNAKMAIEAQGGTLVTEISYDPNAQNFDAQVQEVAAADPDAVLLIGFAESARIIEGLQAQGVGPQDTPLYLVDGNTANYGPDSDTPIDVDLTGTKGTIPGAEATADFRDRLLEVDPDLDSFAYAAESYDAVIIAALAAEAAGSDAPSVWGPELPDVTREGEKCTSFAQCKELLASDTDIDYDGVSGPIEMSDAGDPTTASVGVYTYEGNNIPTTAQQYVSGSIES